MTAAFQDLIDNWRQRFRVEILSLKGDALMTRWWYQKEGGDLYTCEATMSSDAAVFMKGHIKTFVSTIFYVLDLSSSEGAEFLINVCQQYGVDPDAVRISWSSIQCAA